MDNRKTLIPKKIVRLSPSILIAQLIVLEVIIIFFGIGMSLLSVPLSRLIGMPADMFQLGLITLSIFEMALTAVVVAKWMSEVYYIYETSIVHRIGILSVKEEEYSLRNIEALTANQSLLGRLLNFGTLHFFSPVLRQEYYLSNVPDVFSLRNLVDEIVNSVKSEGTKEKIIYRR